MINLRAELAKAAAQAVTDVLNRHRQELAKEFLDEVPEDVFWAHVEKHAKPFLREMDARVFTGAGSITLQLALNDDPENEPVKTLDLNHLLEEDAKLWMQLGPNAGLLQLMADHLERTAKAIRAIASAGEPSDP